MGENKDKELYNKSICKYCIYKDTCNQNVFTVNVFKDKTTMYCVKYEYNRPKLDFII